MSCKVIFVTGTDTGVGKTVVAALLTRELRARGVRVAALKPVCSGDRRDARALRKAAGCVLSLDDVNPWHYKAALAPVLAARAEGRSLTLVEVDRVIRAMAARFDAVIVEGAGGLLSPLGEGFDSRDLIRGKAMVIVVAPNRLGAVNQARLVIESLPRFAGRIAPVVLVGPRKPDSAAESNPVLLGEFIGSDRVHLLPWMERPLTSTPLGRPLAGLVDYLKAAQTRWTSSWSSSVCRNSPASARC